MKAILAVALWSLTALVWAATPAQEKQFVDGYKKAFETKDVKTLHSMIYTQGADPMALAFYKDMMAAEAGAQVTSIQLVDLTAKDRTDAENMTSPDGKKMKLVLPPTKKLVIKSQTKDKNGSSSGTSQMFVAEQQGKLYVLVPAAAK